MPGRTRISVCILICTALAVLASCTPETGAEGGKECGFDIFPDYRDVTIPCNIAPMNFQVSGTGKFRLVISGKDENISVVSHKGTFHIPQRSWKEMTEKNRGGDLLFSIYRKGDRDKALYGSFNMHVADEEADPYISFRLIPPGYTGWHHMGIYQRCIEDFRQSEIITNRHTDGNCMNCHSFCMQDPGRMLFHVRATHAGTVMATEAGIEKIDTKAPETISPLVYPSWHPGGRYVAFSNNDTHQAFYFNDPNRIEVYDDNSDVVIYDTADHLIFSSPLLKSDEAFETFPTFSPDGRSLYFCSARSTESVIDNHREVRYDLCRIDFDEATGRFGAAVDTVFNASSQGRSVSFPRVSPDGSHLIFTLHSFGNFSIWHRDADLWCIDLSEGAAYPLSEANSEETESYHSWSHNGRWVVFTSRRVDGLYSAPFFAYFSDDGAISKPFLLPQRNPRGFYERMQYSFNIPEFITGKVRTSKRELVDVILQEPGQHVSFEWR